MCVRSRTGPVGLVALVAALCAVIALCLATGECILGQVKRESRLLWTLEHGTTGEFVGAVRAIVPSNGLVAFERELVANLGSESDQVRLRAAFLLGAIRKRHAFAMPSELLKLAKSPHPLDRLGVAMALGAFADDEPAALQSLGQILKDQTDEVRERAISSLRKCKSPAARSIFEREVRWRGFDRTALRPNASIADEMEVELENAEECLATWMDEKKQKDRR